MDERDDVEDELIVGRGWANEMWRLGGGIGGIPQGFVCRGSPGLRAPAEYARAAA
jgi:hypothetical protein